MASIEAPSMFVLFPKSAPSSPLLDWARAGERDG